MDAPPTPPHHDDEEEEEEDDDDGEDLHLEMDDPEPPNKNKVIAILIHSYTESVQAL